MTQTFINRRADESFWRDDGKVTHFLGEQLGRGSLILVLGAGVSVASGLPNWDTLVETMAELAGVGGTIAASAARTADAVRRSVGVDKDFAALVRRALYSRATVTADALVKLDLLRAIGAVTIFAANRGGARIITFNYDDLLETYLRFHGLSVESVVRMPAWDTFSQVRICHPHGFLPASSGQETSDDVILTELDLERAMLPGDRWTARLIEWMSANTCVFVGCSGNDSRMRLVLTELQKSHRARAEADLFWGIRTCLVGDTNRDVWRDRGVHCAEFADHGEIPKWLLGVASAAASRSEVMLHPADVEPAATIT